MTVWIVVVDTCCQPRGLCGSTPDDLRSSRMSARLHVSTEVELCRYHLRADHKRKVVANNDFDPKPYSNPSALGVGKEGDMS